MSVQDEKNTLLSKRNTLIARYKQKIKLLEKELEVEVQTIERQIDNLNFREREDRVRKGRNAQET
jgi:hypothetical protein